MTFPNSSSPPAVVAPNPIGHIGTVIGGLVVAWLGQHFGHTGLEVGGFIVAGTPSALHYAAAIFELYWAGPHTRASFVADVEVIAKDVAVDAVEFAKNNPAAIQQLEDRIKSVIATGKIQA
jgi:hypothetical protein